MAFNKGFTAQRWDRARELKELDLKINPQNKDKSLREYYKNDNPVTNKVQQFQVTYELSVLKEDYSFFIPQNTVTYYSYGSTLSLPMVEESLKEGIAQNFKGKARDFMYNNAKVQVRGIENTNKLEYNAVDTNKLKNGSYFDNNNLTFEVVKDKKGTGKNSYKYDLNLWQ